MKSSIFQLIKNLIRLLSYFWKESFFFATLLFVLIILLGIIPAAEFWVIGLFIDHLSETITNNESIKLINIIVLLGSLIGLMLSRNWIRILSEGIQDHLSQKVMGTLQQQVIEKAATVDLEFYEYADSYDQLQRANNGIGNTLMNTYVDNISIIQACISIIAYIFTLSVGHWSLGPIVAIAAIISISLKIKRAKQKYEFDYHTLTPIRKKVQYFSSILASKEYAKEIRIFGSRDYLISKYQKEQSEHADKVYEDEKHDLKNTLINDFSLNLLILIACIFIAISVIGGDVSIGYYAILVQVVMKLMMEMENVTGLVQNNYEYSLFTSNLFSFLDLPTSKDNGPTKKLAEPLKGKIQFDRVWFKYPNSEDWVIKGLSFTIYPKEIVAIVGGNGAGKSTIIKLLLGLFTPQKGQILIDDIPLEEIDKDSVRQYMSAVFQDFTKFELTLRESIAMGNVDKMGDDPLIEKVARQSSVSEWVKRLDQGYDTYLSKQFGGSDLSGGQWQKVALARSLMRDASVLVFDEPTSALDPIAELNVFKEFKELAINKTAILISHRMGSARLADKIIVIEHGEKVEEGIHEELLTNEAVYARLFQTQAKWYQPIRAGEQV